MWHGWHIVGFDVLRKRNGGHCVVLWAFAKTVMILEVWHGLPYIQQPVSQYENPNRINESQLRKHFAFHFLHFSSTLRNPIPLVAFCTIWSTACSKILPEILLGHKFVQTYGGLVWGSIALVITLQLRNNPSGRNVTSIKGLLGALFGSSAEFREVWWYTWIMYVYCTKLVAGCSWVL